MVSASIWVVSASIWVVSASIWMLCATTQMVSASIWMLRATIWMLRATIQMVTVTIPRAQPDHHGPPRGRIQALSSCLMPDITTENRDRVVRYYDARAAEYDRSIPQGWLGRLMRRDVEQVLALLSPQVGERALDAGCGSGIFARRLTQAGLLVCAVDLAPRMLEAARPHAAEVIQADIQELRLDRRFERILCVGVLEFVGDAGRCVENLASHLRPGGRLVVLTPRPSLGGWLYRLWHWWRNGIRARLWDLTALDAGARRAGLRLLAAERSPLTYNLIAAWTRP